MSEHKNSSKLILDLGCGNKKREGTVGVDYNTRLDGDVNHDLNTFPYPFQADSVDKIYIDNCIEHLDSPLNVMEEIHRILKKGGVITAQVGSYDKKPKQVDSWCKVLSKSFGNVKLSGAYIPSFDCNWNFASSIMK